jgi:KaiC/GvpD/RAD55 family RecA-like ATPase
MITRIKSGIDGLDNLTEGGFPEKDLVLLSGTCGAGKTVFGLQFLYSEASKEPGIYVSFEEALPQILSTAKTFGWDTQRLEKVNKLRFLKYDPFKLEDIFEIIESNIREIGARRVVIDSISALGIYVKDPTELRRMILQVSNMLRKNDCTSLLISEILSNENSLSRFGVEEFVSDGVILLHNVLVSGEYRRGLSVWKMRSTNHSKKIHPYRISQKGFVVYPSDTISMDVRR